MGVSSALISSSMSKKIFTPEILLLIGSFIVTGFAILFLFKPPAMDFVKLIKWSKEPSLEYIIESSARRMYPILAESRYLTLKLPVDFPLTAEQNLELIKKITHLPAVADEKDKNFIHLNLDKTRAIVLEIKVVKTTLDQIDPEKHFDALRLQKLIQKIKNDQNPEDLNGHIFALYQTGKNIYTLHIFNLS